VHPTFPLSDISRYRESVSRHGGGRAYLRESPRTKSPCGLAPSGGLLEFFHTEPVRDQCGCTPRQTPGQASSPAAYAGNGGTNAAVTPSTQRFRARRYFQTHRPWSTHWCPRGPDSGGRISPRAPCDSPEYIPLPSPSNCCVSTKMLPPRPRPVLHGDRLRASRRVPAAAPRVRGRVAPEQ
jgi:hypothetical protein